MTTSTALDQQVVAEQERHDLLENLAQAKVDVDPDASLDGLRELWATFGPGAAAKNGKIELQRENQETTEPERELETETAEDDEDETPATPKPDPEGKKLFNDSDYEREDLAIAKVDGNQVDRIAVKFAGEVFLDRSSPADVALYNRLRLGQDVTLMVEGKCSATGAKGATDREGDLDVVVGQRSVKVTTVYIPATDTAAA